MARLRVVAVVLVVVRVVQRVVLLAVVLVVVVRLRRPARRRTGASAAGAVRRRRQLRLPVQEVLGELEVEGVGENLRKTRELVIHLIEPLREGLHSVLELLVPQADFADRVGDSSAHLEKKETAG